jgi:hypothetical protein
MAETITIPISEYGYAAFSASVPLNFGAVPDCEVYYIPHYSYAELRLKKVKGVVPSHFGLLISVSKGVRQITVPIATQEQEEQCGLTVFDNYFIATDEGEYRVPLGEHNIGLGVKNGVPGFYNIAEGAVIPQGKWYMPKLPDTPMFKILFPTDSL